MAADAIVSSLGDHTVAVVLPGAEYCDTLQKRGYDIKRQYSGLPFSQPRLYVPLRPRRYRRLGLRFHSPGSTRGKMGLALARALSGIGMTSHLQRHTISFLAREGSYLRKGTLAQWLAAEIQQGIDDMVIYTGSDSPRHKVTALAIGCNRASDVIIKVAETEQGADAITAESEALRALAVSPLRTHVPELVFEGVFYCYTVQVQSKLDATGRCQNGHFTSGHLNFLADLSKLNRTRRRLGDVRAWQKIKLAVEDADVTDLPEAIREHLQFVLSRDVADKAVITHTTHGDFAPWNIVAEKDKLSVFDWEDSQRNDLPFLDCFHFLYRQAALVGPWAGGQKLVRDMLCRASALAATAGVPGDLICPILRLWVTLEFLDRPCSRIVEVATHVKTSE